MWKLTYILVLYLSHSVQNFSLGTAVVSLTWMKGKRGEKEQKTLPLYSSFLGLSLPFTWKIQFNIDYIACAFLCIPACCLTTDVRWTPDEKPWGIWNDARCLCFLPKSHSILAICNSWYLTIMDLFFSLGLKYEQIKNPPH